MPVCNNFDPIDLVIKLSGRFNDREQIIPTRIDATAEPDHIVKAASRIPIENFIF